MSTEVVSCYIYSEDKSLSPILLPDGEAVFVGRNPETKITDTRVSRKQVRLFASYSDLKVFVQQLGSRPCGLNGFKTEQNAKIVAQHGDRLEILYGKYPYTIEFNPPPATLNTKRKKRTVLEIDNDNSNKEDSQVSKKVKTCNSSMDEVTDEHNLAVPGCSKDTNNTSKNNFNIFDRNKKTEKSGSWKELADGTVYMYKSEGLEARNKIAAYDMDGTLIKTLSGLVFPKDCNDWQLAFPEVPGKLKKMYEDGYKVVIMSNQGRLGVGKITISDFKMKIENIVKKIGLPMQVFLANGRNIYRKPCTGMWDLLVNEHNDGVPVNKEECFYVGDAAGRPAEGKRKKDHSSVDRLLAINIGLKFYTPEEHFLGLKPTKFKEPAFDPKLANKNIKLLDPSNAVIKSQSQELIIMVGSPGSGKSHFVKTYLKDYVYVNRDTLGSWQKCVSAVENALVAGKSVVVDNTNPDVNSRKRYLQVAQSYKVPVRCFVMAADVEHVKHNNKFRSLTDPSHEKISDIIINSYINTESQLVWRCIRFLKLLLLLSLPFYEYYHTLLRPYRKNYVAPTESEGFNEIVRIHFVPKFRSEEDRKLYEMYLLED